MECPSCARETPDASTFCLHCGKSPQRKETEPRSKAGWVIVGVILALLVIIGSLRPNGKSASDDKAVRQNTPVSDANETTEFKMAYIDSNGHISRDDVRVARYRTLLDLLESKAGDPPPNGDENIASMFVFVQEQLKKNGISESMLNLMEGMNQLISPGKTELLSEHLALYQGFRSDVSLSHQETIDAMKRAGPKNIHLLATGKIRPDGKGGLIVETESGTYDFTSEMISRGELVLSR
jgi:hypothetical protein